MARSEHVTFTCDVCGKTEDAVVVDTGSGGPQAVHPLGWFNLEGRYARQGKSPRLKADLCSVECAQTQIERWAE